MVTFESLTVGSRSVSSDTTMAGVLDEQEAVTLVIIDSNSGLLGLGFGLGRDSLTNGETDGDDSSAIDDCCCC